MRTAGAAAKPYQEDSSEFYLITVLYLYETQILQETRRKRGSQKLEQTSTNQLLLPKDQLIGVKFALQKMGIDKAVGSDQILIEAWKCLCDVKWLACLFNNIFLSAKMLDE
ncbi:hypothetical protein Tco_1393061 [Tanacetum coccineum]